MLVIGVSAVWDSFATCRDEGADSLGFRLTVHSEKPKEFMELITDFCKE